MYKKVIKRFLDIIFSLLALPFVLLAIIIVAPLIFFTDKGSIFYNAPRMGKDGGFFKMYKFRSMKMNAPDLRNADGSTFNSDNDPRVTKTGRFMRKTSIDEIPQLLNVLLGEMSLVGPRPCLPMSEYDEITAKRFQVRPGITGYSQAYFRNSITQEEKFLGDAYYVEHLSLWLDIKILWKTFTSVVFQKNINTINDNSKQKILVIGASILQIPIIQKAKEMGLWVMVVDINPKAEGIQYADEYFNASTIDTEAIFKIAKETNPNGIVTLATDMPMRSIASVTERLSLPGISLQTAINATDKGNMRNIFKTQNVASAWFFIIEKIEDLNELKSQLSYPCIMKPTDNAGSRGVILINGEDELENAYNYSYQASRNKKLIIEEYLQGSEVSVEVIVVDGDVHIVAITDKITTGAPHFVELGHCQPSQKNHIEQEKIKDLVCQAVQALGIKSGVAHVEIMLTENGPKMIELGARLGGDSITSHLVPLSTGVDMVKAAIEIALGKKPDITPAHKKGSAIKFFSVEKGQIASITGIEDAYKIDGVQQITFTKNIGDLVDEIKSSVDRVGYVIAQGKDACEANHICDKAIQEISIQVK